MGRQMCLGALMLVGVGPMCLAPHSSFHNEDAYWKQNATFEKQRKGSPAHGYYIEVTVTHLGKLLMLQSRVTLTTSASSEKGFMEGGEHY